jgi:signal transduction histidine kinase
LQKIFEPFFTTKPTGKGTGIGLSVVKTIIDLHGATVDVRNLPEGGFRVTLMFRV